MYVLRLQATSTHFGQTLKASRALLQHVQAEAKRLRESATKKSLLAIDTSDSAGDSAADDDTPIWLTLTTKQHIADQNRLKPSRISVPHSLNLSPDLRICLITTDPQRAVKNVVAHPTFPATLKSRITKIIGFTKLKERYKTFEQRRQLLSDHDVFLADDRIINRLPATLGKVFYKSTSKRPIPISIADQRRVDGKRPPGDAPKKAATKNAGAVDPASPEVVAKEIEKALNAVPVTLRPGVNMALRVGLASFEPQQLADNIIAVAQGVIDRHVVKGWKNVRAIHVKSSTSLAVPIWLADELWTDSDNVADDASPLPEDDQDQEHDHREEQKKRKRNTTTTKGPQAGPLKRTKTTETEAIKQGDLARKSKLADLKAQAFKEVVAS